MIYQPAEDSYLLQSFVKKYAAGNVLDVGTGTGIQAAEAFSNKKTKNVVAVDISKRSINHCRKNIKKNKINFVVSDLFDKINGKFDTIIFNPPYLPEDKREPLDSRTATTGGKKGYELIARFFSEVNDFLKDDGRILIVFSSLTKKNKVDEIIENNLFESRLLGTKKVSFETLYTYSVKKSNILKYMNKKDITKIRYFTKGKRGKIYTGIYDGKKVAIKIKNPKTEAKDVIKKETYWMKKMNEIDIGPNYLFHTNKMLVYEFVEGKNIFKFINDNPKQTKSILKDILRQCRRMDDIGVNKKEMHHPIKHIIIKNKPVFIDFERCHKTEKTKNVTQFIQFITQYHLVNKPLKVRKLARIYKKNRTDKNFRNLLNEI